MTNTYSRLIELLQLQMTGNRAATTEIREIANQICGIKVFRDPDLTPQQVRGLELVLSEWREMFSFEPGRPEGLPPILDLMNFIFRNAEVEQMRIYSRPEWKKIVSLRGPVETVQIIDCGSCHTKYPRMGTSGFLDIIDLNCSGCGGIVFKSAYSDQTETQCACGGTAKLGCPNCKSLKGKVIEEMSPYQYFMDHRMAHDDAS